MKRGRRLTRSMKIAMSNKKLNVNNWVAINKTDSSFTVSHKNSKNVRTLLF